jgi:hypothetical protein
MGNSLVRVQVISRIKKLILRFKNLEKKVHKILEKSLNNKQTQIIRFRLRRIIIYTKPKTIRRNRKRMNWVVNSLIKISKSKRRDNARFLENFTIFHKS